MERAYLLAWAIDCSVIGPPIMASGLLRRFFESLIGVPQAFRQIPGSGFGNQPEFRNHIIW
jgi:hypothetical protein